MQSPADKRRQKALEQARHDLQAHLLAHIAAREHARETRDLATVAALRRAVRMWEDMHDTQKGGLITAGVRGGGRKVGPRAAFATIRARCPLGGRPPPSAPVLENMGFVKERGIAP